MVGADFQRSTQLSDSFFHPRDSHSRSPSGRHATQLLRWNTLALVFYLNDNLMVGAMKANFRRRTSRMPMNVRKTFLHKPKTAVSISRGIRPKSSGQSRLTLILLRRANPSVYQGRAEASPASSSKGGWSK